jgi:hypothetical protein
MILDNPMISKALASFAVGVIAVSVPEAALSQNQCYQVAAFVAPNQLRCQQVGTDYLGKPVWLCC